MPRIILTNFRILAVNSTDTQQPVVIVFQNKANSFSISCIHTRSRVQKPAGRFANCSDPPAPPRRDKRTVESRNRVGERASETGKAGMGRAEGYGKGDEPERKVVIR